MGVTRSKYGFRVYYRGQQEYFAIRKFGSPEATERAANAYFAEMEKLLPKPDPNAIPMPYVSDTWTISGLNRVNCFAVYYWSAKRKRNSKKFTYENPDDRIEADRKARAFLAARIREWEAGK